jgi:DNA invertase Pin-like site-specific DNA recombinase
MQQAIGYLRVSTREQGRSGLGLAAERFDIQAFAAREGFAVQSWYQDIQTGAGRDPLTLRPALATALKKARAAHCPLIVSSLDRLSRNVHFIASLLEHHVHFVVAQLGRDCDEFTLHIYACLAEQERKLISERAKATAEVEKTRGRQFGLQLRSRAWQRRVRALGKAALVQEANDRAQAFRAKQVAARCALEHPLGVRGAEVMLKRVRRAAALRSALHQRVGWPLDRWTALRIRIGGILQRHPEFTGPQVLERLGPAGAPRLIWVWQVIREVHAATHRPSAHARRKGKRFYHALARSEARSHQGTRSRIERGGSCNEGRHRVLAGEHARAGAQRVGTRGATPRHRPLRREGRLFGRGVVSGHSDGRRQRGLSWMGCRLPEAVAHQEGGGE